MQCLPLKADALEMENKALHMEVEQLRNQAATPRAEVLQIEINNVNNAFQYMLRKLMK